jgi:hypothetical protein
MTLAKSQPFEIPAPTPETAASTDSDRRGAATVWAGLGVLCLVVAAQALVRWAASPTEFAPAPILGPDVPAEWRLVALRALEVLSVGVLLGFLWFCVVRPWRQRGRLSLDGKFVLGGLVAFVADGFLNSNAYLFAWNSNNVNRGVWTSFLPFHGGGATTRYAESLLWGPPMYVYFCAGVAIVACRAVAPLRRRCPDLSNVALFSTIWVGEFVFDFVLENLIIRTTHGYAYAQTLGGATLWAGQLYQFPIYESILVATLGCLYTWMRMAALQDPDGLSPVERGFHRWRPALRGPIRTLAVIGFCSVATILIYHLPFNWLGLIGHSMAALPSYLRPG